MIQSLCLSRRFPFSLCLVQIFCSSSSQIGFDQPGRTLKTEDLSADNKILIASSVSPFKKTILENILEKFEGKSTLKLKDYRYDAITAASVMEKSDEVSRKLIDKLSIVLKQGKE